MLNVRSATPRDKLAFDAITEATTPHEWATLTASTSRSLIAETTGGPSVGFIEAQQAGDDIEIIMIATLLSVRRQGIGTQLLEALFERARSDGASRVILDVADDNIAARQLYAKFGFKELARRRNYYRTTGAGQPRDALLLAYSFASGQP